jgi:hypothetical protein
MLDAFQWTGLGADNQWNTNGNWIDLTTNRAVAPNAANAVVTISGTATIHIPTGSPDILLENLQILGGSSVSLVFDGNSNLTIQHNATDHAGGNLVLTESPGVNTSFSISTNQVTSLVSFSALNFAVVGDKSGTSTLNVGAHTTLITEDFDSSHYAFTANVAGSIDTHDMYMEGQDQLANASWNTSALNINGGGLLVGDVLRLGGEGPTSMLSDAGTVLLKNVEVHNDANVTFQNTLNPTVTTGPIINGNLYIGSGPTGSTFVPSADTESATGAQVTFNGAKVIANVFGATSVNGGMGVVVNAENGAIVGLDSLTVGAAGALLATGPLVEATGGGNVQVTKGATIGMGTTGYLPGKFLVGSGSTATVGETLTIASSWPTPTSSQLEIDASGTLQANQALFGASPSLFLGIFPMPTLVYSHSTIAGTLILTNPSTAAQIGDGGPDPDVINLTGTITATGGGTIYKNVGGYVTTTGTITGPVVKATGTGADFVPGDYFTMDDSGNIVPNSTPPVATFGTLTINGDLDASQGMTLDEVFGEGSGEANGTSQNSMLAVTGNVTLGSNSELRIGLANGQDPTTYVSDYQAGDSFTLLTGGNITGEFANLPEGTYAGASVLPLLPSGLKWHVQYSSIAITISVNNAATKSIDEWIGWNGIDIYGGTEFAVGDGNYNDPSNWSEGHVPESGDIAEFNGPNLIELTADAPTFGGLIINGWYSSTENFPFTNIYTSNYNFNIDGDINVAPTANDSAYLGIWGSGICDNILDGDGANSSGRILLEGVNDGDGDYVPYFNISDSIEVGGKGQGEFNAENLIVTAQNLFVDGANGNSYFSIEGTSDTSAALTLSTSAVIGITLIGEGSTSTWSRVASLDATLNVASVIIKGGQSTMFAEEATNCSFTDLNLEEGANLTLIGNSTVTTSTLNISNSVLNDVSGTCTATTAYNENGTDTLSIGPGSQLSSPIMNISGDIEGNLITPSSTTMDTSLYGNISVTGVIGLGGSLAIQSVEAGDNSFYQPGDTFTILSAAGGITGEFTSISGLPELQAGLSWEIIYSSNALIAEVSPNANFTPTTGNVSIVADSDAGTIQISDGNQTSTLAMTGLTSLTITAGSGNETVVVDQSNGNASLPGGLNIVGTGNITLQVSGGAMVFAADIGANAANLTIEASNGAALTFNATQNLAGLVLDAGTSAAMGPGWIGLNLGSLTIAGGATPTARLDVNQGGFQINASLSAAQVATIVAQLIAGRDGGAWDGGEGIVSSLAASENVTAGREAYAIGYLQPWTDGPLVVRYTFSGDANLDGSVDLNDLNLVLNNLGTAGAAWYQGNLDYAATVDLTSMNDVLNELGLSFF